MPCARWPTVDVVAGFGRTDGDRTRAPVNAMDVVFELSHDALPWTMPQRMSRDRTCARVLQVRWR